MLLKLLAPHFRRAMSTAAEFADQKRQRDAVTAAFGRLQHGLVVLDRRALVVHASETVRDILKIGDGIRLTPRGLRAVDPAAGRQLEMLIAEALSCHETGGVRPLAPVRIPRRAPAPPLLVQAFPLPARSPRSRDPWTSGRPEDGAVILVFVDLAQRYRPPPELLRLAFGLTAAEAAVALRLLEGTGVKAVAADLGISDSTVRTHVLHIFSKTGTRRQAELVRLLTGLAPILATEPVRV